MIPYSYNMVDMGGIDLAEVNGTVVEGLYNRLALARNACGDLILFNWKFAEIEIAPGACSTLDVGTSILINGVIEVTEEDVVSLPGIAPEPVLAPLAVTENGVYRPEEGVTGFNEVSVNVVYDGNIYAVKDENLDAILDGFGGTSIEAGYSSRVITPMCILLSRNPSSARFYVKRSSYFSNKACLYSTTDNLTSIICPTKIIAGKYSKLVIEYVIESRVSDRGLIVGCGRKVKCVDAAFIMNIKSSNLGIESDPVGVIQIKELDISDVAEDFYFGMYQWGYNFCIRNFYVTN